MRVSEEIKQGYWPIPKGWYSLMKKLLEDLNNIDPNIEILQMKEKWGGLRVYISPHTDIVYKLCFDAEEASLKICDTCGRPGKLREGSWLRTKCDEC